MVQRYGKRIYTGKIATLVFLDVARPRQAIGQAERREGGRPRGGRWEEAAHRQGNPSNKNDVP
eukprot:929393-Prorocentrum_minimum.AAC.1